MKYKNEKQILLIIKYSPPLFILIGSLIITFLIYLDYSKTFNQEKSNIENTYLINEKEKTKKTVESVIYYINKEYNSTEKKLEKTLENQILNVKVIINSIYQNNKNTKSKNEITKLIKDAIRDIRFNNNRGYFFINQIDGVSILHPIFPKREGKNISQEKDTQGVQRFRLTQEIVKSQKKGFTNFFFHHPENKTEQKKKLVYIELFEPYNWIIGTGEYINDFEEDIKESVLEHISDLGLENDKYVFIMNRKGDFLYHPRKDLNGKNLFSSELKDSKELNSFTEVFKKQRNNIDYYEYKVKNSNNNILSRKISYLKKISRWDWIIGSGFALEKIEPIIEKKKIFLEKKYTNYVNTILISSIIITLFLLLISFYISKILENSFNKYKNSLKKEISENIRQKEILKKAQEVAHIGDWELDLKTMKAIWSDEISKIFELDKKLKNVGPELLKKIMVEEDWHKFETSLKICINTGENHRCIYRIKVRENRIKWIDCRGELDKDKEKIIGVIQDITENKNLEIEKKEKERMLFQQSKMAAMGEMLENIAHQWRQPLSTISTNATGIQLQKELGVLKDADLVNSMISINNSAQYLSQTIEDFRNFYKPNTTNTTFNINELINKTINLLSSQFSSNDIKLINEAKEIEIYSLENGLIQVLVNILNNAKDALCNDINHMEKRMIFIKTYDLENQINIEILDNAKGIKDEIIDKIFEPYFTTKHQSKGTGIGLYMSKQIIEKHLKGEILVKNEEFIYEDKKYTGAKFNLIINKNNDTN